jgi:hypothetical protein
MSVAPENARLFDEPASAVNDGDAQAGHHQRVRPPGAGHIRGIYDAAGDKIARSFTSDLGIRIYDLQTNTLGPS